MATIVSEQSTISKEYSTSIEGVADVEIRPQISGYLQKILVDDGAYVKAGQTLFIIESSIYREQYNTAQANLSSAKIELDRKKELAKSKIVSSLQVDQAEAAYKGAQAQVGSARINLNFCTIKAPVSGYIGRVGYRLGSLIAPSNPTPITILSDIHKVNAYFSMSENDFQTFQSQYPGKNILKNSPKVNLQLSNGEEYEIAGQIDAVNGQFDSNTGAITLRAKFDNPKTILRSGSTGKIIMKQVNNNAVLLPIASTMGVQDKIFAFIVDKQGKAKQIEVKISGKTGTKYIISEGLKPGDTYIVSGFDRLQSGTPVTAQKTAKI
ncbi:efflux RND transporter periplasmic adaptor subunit [Flavobacterium sp. ST-87]|uniref:Efflux RND transporter periplasmic adaptor subunit n=1 Tax=Flavobacterium plantiphilum TaxID=3163297 RepID=A0ABW8XV86_9FLAO